MGILLLLFYIDGYLHGWTCQFKTCNIVATLLIRSKTFGCKKCTLCFQKVDFNSVLKWTLYKLLL